MKRMWCTHCGKPINATHQRRYPDSTRHVTCATGPVIDGECPHSKCCCQAHPSKEI